MARNALMRAIGLAVVVGSFVACGDSNHSDLLGGSSGAPDNLGSGATGGTGTGSGGTGTTGGAGTTHTGAMAVGGAAGAAANTEAGGGAGIGALGSSGGASTGGSSTGGSSTGGGTSTGGSSTGGTAAGGSGGFQATGGTGGSGANAVRPRVIVATDGEIDDECSLVRFLLYADEWDVQGIITTSSQYHWQSHSWAGDTWETPYLDAYAKVFSNLAQNDPRYPTADYLRQQLHVGNVKTEGDMAAPTDGSQHIVNVLLDATDQRPIWLLAWGGTNTFARALKTIEDEHPDRMAEVAKKLRLYFIWEQDSTYQDYIRPHWAKYAIPTIVSDQFITFGYWYQDWDFPSQMGTYFSAAWMHQNLLDNRGPLLALYQAQADGSFRSEGDSPSFLDVIPTGLRSNESPDWGGWGGRYVLVRPSENTWLDPVPVSGYQYPTGRWYTNSAWGRVSLRNGTATQQQLNVYFKPIWRWVDVIQNDFAARADWCVKPYSEANHPPMVQLAQAADLTVQPGATVQLSAAGTTDPDGDPLDYHWWQYREAESYGGTVNIQGANSQNASFVVPADAGPGQTIHLVIEVTDHGTPPLTRYQRVVATVAG